LIFGFAAGAAEPAAKRAEPSLVVTQLPLGTAAEKAGASSGGTLRADYGEGGRLVLVRGGRRVTVLTPVFASAADPDVSFDGKRILFAGQRKPGDRWAIFEMSSDGSGVRQVLDGPDDLRQPVYLPTVFTIIADPTRGTEPREQIGYVRHDASRRNEAGPGPARSLHSVKPDGTAPRRLAFSLSAETDPVVLGDGRILYATWQRATLDHGPHGRVSLVGVNSDGTDPALFSADEGRRVKAMPCLTRDRLVVFVEADEVGWDGAGTLASVSLRRNLHSHRPITAEGDGLFHSPSPLPDGGVLAARRPADGTGTHGIVRVDPASGRVEPVFDDPAYHDMQPRSLAARPAPDGRSSAVKDPDHEAQAPAGTHAASPAPSAGRVLEGKLYGLDVNVNDLGPRLEPGTIRKIRVIEGLPAEADEPATALSRRRLVGEAPVEADGSFQVRVPAETPLLLQIVDGDGLALRSSGWVWSHHRGQQGCIGCHEDGERTPANRFVDALGKPAVDLLLPPQRRRTVDYRHDVAPIVEARCRSCHGEGKAVRLGGADDYDTLGRFVDPGRARTSPLVWHLLGRNTSRPWDGEAGRRAPARMPRDAGLTEDERRLVVEWIDLGAIRDMTLAGAGAASGGVATGGGTR
jgi:hypothetical protein